MLSHHFTFTALQRPDPNAMVAHMKSLCVLCMASGTVDAIDKYVFYAQQHNSSLYYFVSVDVVMATNETSVIIRTRNDTSETLVQEFAELIEKALRDIMT
jgi:Beta2-adaptin appendage, C-terminal sub-domain